MIDPLTLDQMRVLVPAASVLPNFEKNTMSHGVSAAARKLGRVQSAISQAVQAMETALQVTLFDRSRKIPTLTETGAALLDDARAVLAKIREEIDEVEAELDAGRDDLAEAELGDLLFVVVNLARHLKADPEAALRAANAKFERRFGYIEGRLAAEGREQSLAAEPMLEIDRHAPAREGLAQHESVFRVIVHQHDQRPVLLHAAIAPSASGAVTVNSAPSPISLATASVQPCRSQTVRQNARPIPVPLTFSRGSSRVNGSKMSW